jgi:hypothetical protein
VKGKWPGGAATPRTRPTERKLPTVDTARIPPAGDPFTAKTPETDQQRLARLEDRYRHELLDDAERQELRERVLRLRRQLSR